MAAKDKRLYARIDIGFDEHDKIYPLSDAAFRALVEATLYSRRQLTDGFLAERMTLKKWGAEVIEELSTNDPERPSLIRVDGGWQIHDFAEHQTTNADIDAKREAGAKGAAKRWHSRSDRSPMGNPMPNDGGTLAKTETETDTDTDTSLSKERDNRARRGSRISDDWMPTPESIAKVRDECPNVDPQKEHPVFIDYWIAQPGQKGVKVDWDATWRNWMRRKQQDSAGKKLTPMERAAQTAAAGRRVAGLNITTLNPKGITA